MSRTLPLGVRPASSLQEPYEGLDWDVVEEMSLRSHLDNKAVVPPSPVPLLVCIWGLEKELCGLQAALGQGFQREDRTAKAHENRRTVS